MALFSLKCHVNSKRKKKRTSIFKSKTNVNIFTILDTMVPDDAKDNVSWPVFEMQTA